MKRTISIVLALLLSLVVIAGCGNQTVNETAIDNADQVVENVAPLEDGVYSVKFDTDNSMFHVNEVCDGRATLTVEDGVMTLHLVLTSQNIVNLYKGVIADVENEGAQIIDPVLEEVTYPDGLTEEVNAFDVVITVIDEEFDLALIGTKGVWYDHKVIVSDPILVTNDENTSEDTEQDASESQENQEDSVLSIEVTLEGGSGKATIDSPATVMITDDGYVLVVGWSSEYYDYMIVDDVKYLPVNTEGNSVFEIPVSDFSEDLNVIADTVAMSEPHEIEYVICFDESTLK